MQTVAMHISNGIINGQVSAAFALRRGRRAWRSASCAARGDLDDRLAPMAGLVAAFIFAVQMLNFPIFSAGVSGHLLGGALAAILVGPWVGALCVTVVLIVQALVFADGGVTALGLNITNMALLGTAAGYLLVVVAAEGAAPHHGRARHHRVRRGAGRRGRGVDGLRRSSSRSAARSTWATRCRCWPATMAGVPPAHRHR